jgi:predicted secreted Zn-dependent protease
MWMASFAVLSFLFFAGLNFGTQPEAEFIEVEMALENAVAGSEGTTCYKTITEKVGSQIFYCGTCSWVMNSTYSWVSGTGTC